MPKDYLAIVSSDWNGCLAPCGPFDYIVFHFPQLKEAATKIFQSYTANRISLGQAMVKVSQQLPEPITPGHMDTYLDDAFRVYPGVIELMEWCASRRILFMINTTAVRGYFQRIFAKQLLPSVAVISAHPMITFQPQPVGSPQYIALDEIETKALNTEIIMKQNKIPYGRQILMGDSGGDGPHFQWGRGGKGFLIGCHTKPSLHRYCEEHAITLDLDFSIGEPAKRSKDDEDARGLDFRQLIDPIDQFLKAGHKSAG